MVSNITLIEFISEMTSSCVEPSNRCFELCLTDHQASHIQLWNWFFESLSKSDQWLQCQGHLVGMSYTRYVDPELGGAEMKIWELTPIPLLRKSEVKKSIFDERIED